ncbi:hypothetical protein [Tahibacter amnicola]|uniref:Secreted protein n=1 Tax=Tahibacter amnicola TaxID=2976241 RepID=A0ABY6B9I6_9GAMM|nr:hypothetical protein [Tahibacter amnicola]UXI66728.1 hypothetical protein N4264_18505 [Tahibacter amnicola]
MLIRLVTGAVLLGALALGIAGDVQAAVPALRCEGCTPAQSRQMVLSRPGLGIRFTYGFSNHHVRKFQVMLDGAGKQEDLTPEELAKATRIAVDMPVDTDVQRLWSLLDQIHTLNPDLIEHGRVNVDLGDVGVTAGTNGMRPFDISRVAWDAPRGQEYQRFMQRMRDLLKSQAGTQALNRDLASAIHDFLPGIKGVYIEGGSSGGTVGMSFEGTSETIDLKVCDPAGNCVFLHYTTGTKSLVYDHAEDPSNNVWPSQLDQFPYTWRFHDRNDAIEFGRNVARHGGGGFTMGLNNCFEAVVTCARTSTNFIGCRVDCMW